MNLKTEMFIFLSLCDLAVTIISYSFSELSVSTPSLLSCCLFFGGSWFLIGGLMNDFAAACDSTIME